MRSISEILLLSLLRLTAQPRTSARYRLQLPQLSAGINPRICRVTRPAELRHAGRSLAASCRLTIIPTPPIVLLPPHAASQSFPHRFTNVHAALSIVPTSIFTIILAALCDRTHAVLVSPLTARYNPFRINFTIVLILP